MNAALHAGILPPVPEHPGLVEADHAGVLTLRGVPAAERAPRTVTGPAARHHPPGQGEASMQKRLSRCRIGLVAAALAAFAVPALAPVPAAAWWHHGRGWHPGWGYRPGCCWRPPPLVVYAPPRIVAPPVWIPAHWNGPYWTLGHWS